MTDEKKMNTTTWECPVCKTRMMYNGERDGIISNKTHLLIPLICPSCKMEAWIKAIPDSIIVFKEFTARLENADIC